MALIAMPDGGSPDGTMMFTVGTNQIPQRPALQAMTYAFQSSPCTVTGTYTSPDGASQNGSVTANVVSHGFIYHPDAGAGTPRHWHLPPLPTSALFDSPHRL